MYAIRLIKQLVVPLLQYLINVICSSYIYITTPFSLVVCFLYFTTPGRLQTSTSVEDIFLTLERL